MQIVPSTFLALILIAILLIKGPLRGMPWFFVFTPFGAAAAFNMPAVGGASIGIIDLGALVLFALVLSGPAGMARIAGSMRAGQPGFYLVLLTFYCIVATIIFPRLFAGQTEVFGVSRADNKTEIVSVLLRPTAGNITQLFRIMLDVLAFYAIATLFRAKPDVGIAFKAIIVATVANVVLGWADVVTFAAGVPQVLEPIRTANYSMLIDHRMAGLKRMIGGFPEASSFGFYSLGLFGFWLRYWVTGTQTRVAFWCLLMTGIVLLRSTSSSSYVAAGVLLAFFAGGAILKSVGGQVRRRALIFGVVGLLMVWFVALAGVVAYEAVQPVTDFLDSVLFDKIESQSGVERMSWNVQAYKNFLDTWMMGAGLGSIRASNWLLACLGSIGVVGTGLFLMFLGSLARIRFPQDDNHVVGMINGLKTACLALFISAMLTLPTPDLGIFFFAVAGLITGLARGLSRESLEQPNPTTTEIVHDVDTISRRGGH